MEKRVLIVGMAPGRSGVREPLAGSSGRRLALLCGITFEDYLARFERTNLCPEFLGKVGKGDAFPSAKHARALADDLLLTLAGRRVVVLGFVNALAFGIEWPMFTFGVRAGAEIAYSPHPSGVNRWWNEAENQEAARAFWRRVAGQQDG